MKVRVSVAALLLLAAQIAVCGESLRPGNTAKLKTTLGMLNLLSPESDVNRNAAHGDLRFVGLTDYSCHPPGRGSHEEWELVESYGIRCLEGTSDAWESAEHGELIHAAVQYAKEYNRALLSLIRDVE